MSAAKARHRLGKEKNVNPVKKFGEGIHTHSTPNYVNTTGGRREGGVAGEPRDTRYSWGGGVRKSPHTKRRGR